MRSVLLPLAAACLLCGCAAFREAEAPGCSGPRRPANPHGSVLSAGPEAPSPAARTGGQCSGDRS